MISSCFSKCWTTLCLLGLILSPQNLAAHDPSAPKVLPGPATLNVKAPDFVLINQDGARFDSAKLRGKIVAIDFIYTTCTDVCPLFTVNFAQLQRTLNKEHAADVFLISITTDPEIDSPKVLKSYAQRYGAEFNNWAFLTGPEEQLKAVWKGLDVRVIKKGRGLVQHTSLTMILDRQGIRRFNHFGEKWQTKDLLSDISTLLEKKS